MNAILDRLESDMARVLGSIPKPAAPKPLWPSREIPDDRSDFTKDDEATGV